MNIQSFSIVVPSSKCINKCPFCVSRMVDSSIYPNLMDMSHPSYDYNVKEYMRRMKHVAGTGCQTLMLTGTSEPQQNKQFLNTFALMHEIIGQPFQDIEMQTTGMLLDNRSYLRFLRNFVGVSTIALSISSPVPAENAEVIGHPHSTSSTQYSVDFAALVKLLKEYGFNIRLCFNLTKHFTFDNAQGFFDWCSGTLKADQITFRKLYASGKDTPQGQWIAENSISSRHLVKLVKALKLHPVVGSTVYGADVRSINGMSVVFDDDCMGKHPTKDAVKYLILRPNCKLYSSWDDPASLVF